MSDTGKTITISNEAYLEIKRLNEANAELKKENENLSASIKGMASGKANLDKSYQELEGLYGRL